MLNFYKLLLLIIVISIVNGCSDNTVAPTKPVNDINELVLKYGTLNTSVNERTEILSQKNSTIEENGKKWQVKETKHSFAKNLDKEILPFNTNANSLWPGSLVQGREVPNGNLNTLGDNISRTPITITVKSGDKLFGSAEISKPNNANYSASLSNILKTVTGNTSANMIYNQSIAYDKKQSLMNLGISYKWLGSGLDANFNIENTSDKKEVVIFFKQEYYTVSVNEPSKPSDYFGDNINLDDLKFKIGEGNPLCYVSSVTYGRLLMAKMTYIGNESITKVDAELKGALKLIADGNGGYENSNVINKSNFKGIILGGSAGGAAKGLTEGSIESIVKFINEEANYSSNSPGYPISYTVKNILDNSTVKLGETTEYTSREYTESPDNNSNFDIEFKGFYVQNDCDPHDNGNFYYNIDVLDKNDNSLINSKISVSSSQSIKASNGEWVKIANAFHSFKLFNGANEIFRIKGYIVEKNTLVNDILLEFNKVFEHPWSSNEIINDYTIDGVGGFYGIPISRDSGCRVVLLMKITKK